MTRKAYSKPEDRRASSPAETVKQANYKRLNALAVRAYKNWQILKRETRVAKARAIVAREEFDIFRKENPDV